MGWDCKDGHVTARYVLCEHKREVCRSALSCPRRAVAWRLHVHLVTNKPHGHPSPWLDTQTAGLQWGSCMQYADVCALNVASDSHQLIQPTGAGSGCYQMSWCCYGKSQNHYHCFSHRSFKLFSLKHDLYRRKCRNCRLDF